MDKIIALKVGKHISYKKLFMFHFEIMYQFKKNRKQILPPNSFKIMDSKYAEYIYIIFRQISFVVQIKLNILKW